MKTIVITPSGLTHYADSSMGRDSMPLFLPDFFEDWTLDACLAFRVGRLGKSIPAKFALRYVDAISIVGLLMHPSQPAWLSIMDSAVTTGKWLDICDEYALEAACDDVCEQWAISGAEVSEALTAAIVEASRYGTLKTGDVIIPALPRATFAPARNRILQASINGENCLRIKIK